MGGAIFTLGDLALSMAANSLRQSGGYTERIYLLSAFVQPGKTQSRGSTGIANRQNKRYRVDITDGNGRLIAEMTGTCCVKGYQKQ